MVIFKLIYRIRNAEGEVRLKLVFVLIVTVPTLSFKMPKHGLGCRALATHLLDIVGDSVLVFEGLAAEFFVVLLNVKLKFDAGIYNRLTV